MMERSFMEHNMPGFTAQNSISSSLYSRFSFMRKRYSHLPVVTPQDKACCDNCGKKCPAQCSDVPFELKAKCEAGCHNDCRIDCNGCADGGTGGGTNCCGRPSGYGCP